MEEVIHETRFPGESDKYRDARNKLLKAEIELREQIEAIASQRRELPIGGNVKEDYEFEELEKIPGNGKAKITRLSELFTNNNTSLIIYSFMFSEEMQSPCPSCTSILDSMEGSVKHVNQKVDLVVVAKSPISRIKNFANGRGWKNLRLVSSEKNSYNRDYFAEGEDGSQWPACNVFTKREGGIHHFYSTELLYVKSDMQPRHVDLLWPLWNFFDLTTEGRGLDWYPKLNYD